MEKNNFNLILFYLLKKNLNLIIENGMRMFKASRNNKRNKNKY